VGGMFTLCHYKSTNAFVTPKNQNDWMFKNPNISILDSKKERKEKKQRFRLAYDILDETICAHIITTLNIHKMSGFLKSIPQNLFCT
jgi:hypothetical protein